MFTYDEQGRILFGEQPYPDLSCGTTAEGQYRAKVFVVWLNACLTTHEKPKEVTDAPH